MIDPERSLLTVCRQLEHAVDGEATRAAEGVAKLKTELEARSGQGDIIAGEIVRGPLTQAMEACP